MYAKPVVRRFLMLAAAGALLSWTGLTLAQEKSNQPPKTKDIVVVAKDVHNLKTFSKLLESAGLVDTLQGKGPFTVLAPTDAAFKKLGKELDELQKPENKAKLQRLLKNHVFDTRKSVADIMELQNIKTLAGEELQIAVEFDEEHDEEILKVGTAVVTRSNLHADNGLIHLVDTVLVPAEKAGNQP